MITNKHIVSLSGGKDSVTMTDMMIEKGMRIDLIQYADVGEMAEFMEMYPYIDFLEKRWGREIKRIKSEKHTARSIFYGYPAYGKHMDEIRGFPLTIGSGCRYRSWLKTDVLEASAGTGNTIYIGYAADEQNRAKSSEYAKGRNTYRFPLIEWGITEQDCLEYIRKHDLWNCLYNHFFRLGCFWCPKQSINSLRNLFLYYPQYWKIMKQMEVDQGRPFHVKHTIPKLEDRFIREKHSGKGYPALLQQF